MHLTIHKIKSDYFSGGTGLVLLRIAIILALLLVSGGLAFLATRKIIFSVAALGLAVGVLGAVLLFRYGKLEHGLMLIFPLAGLTNFITLPTGTASRIVLSLLVTILLMGAWVLQIWTNKREPAIKPSPIVPPLLSFVAINIIAYFWSNALRDIFVDHEWGVMAKARIAALAVNILLPLLALLVSQKLRELKWLRILAWSMLGLGFLVTLSSLLNLPLDAIFYNGSRGLFVLWISALAFSFALFNEEIPLWLRGLLLVMVGGWIFRNFINNTHWLSGWLPMAVALVVLTFFRSKLVFSLAAVAGILIIVFNYSWFYDRIYLDNVEEGSSNRVLLWETNLELIRNHPLFGMGPAGYAPYYMTYHPTFALSTHNNYFDILAQTGILGMLAFLGMMATFLGIGYKVQHGYARQRNFEEAFSKALLAGGIGAMAAMMLGDWVLPFAYNQTITGFDNAAYTWMFLGSIISLYHIQRGEA